MKFERSLELGYEKPLDDPDCVICADIGTCNSGERANNSDATTTRAIATTDAPAHGYSRVETNSNAFSCHNTHNNARFTADANACC